MRRGIPKEEIYNGGSGIIPERRFSEGGGGKKVLKTGSESPKTVDIQGMGCYDSRVAACPGRGAPFLRCASGSGKEAFGRMEMLKAGGRKVVGTKQVLRALKAGTVSRVYAANDADTFIYQQVVRNAEDAGVPCVRVPSMKELGMICGVDVPTAAAGLLK